MGSRPAVVDRSILIVYVDDFALVASKGTAYKHWKTIEKVIVFKEVALPILRYLGAHYKFDEISASKQFKARALTTGMSNYLLALVEEFQKEYSGKLYPAKSPHRIDTPWIPERDEAGVFQTTAASFTA